MFITIDRIEGDFAVVELENRILLNLPVLLFPEAKEGDVVSISVDHEETEKRKKIASDLLRDLFTE